MGMGREKEGKGGRGKPIERKRKNKEIREEEPKRRETKEGSGREGTLRREAMCPPTSVSSHCSGARPSSQGGASASATCPLVWAPRPAGRRWRAH